MNQNSYQTNRGFADSYTDAVKDILKQNAMHIVTIAVAQDNLDKQQATDMTITISGGCVAVRVRRDNTRYRDLTIRSRTKFGGKTELAKIREGFADWYLYCWTKDGNISEWIIVDLDCLRESGLLDLSRKEIPNGDGTYFVNVTIAELRANNCIASGCME